jgi:PST family polysaccharide transporter
MGTDFYPRLTSIARDHEAMKELVNQQMEVALLLSGPAMLGFLTFTPVITYILYSPTFAAANSILRWQIVGTLYKVLSWPMGFIILAKGRGTMFFLTELAWNLFYIAGIWSGKSHFGLLSTGISFFAAYFAYLFIVYLMGIYLINFKFSYKVITLVCTLSVACFVVLLLSSFSFVGSYVIGSIFTMAAVIYSLKRINQFFGGIGILRIARKVRTRFPVGDQ